MSQSVSSSDYRLIESFGLKDYGDFCQAVKFINVVDGTPDSDRGEWFFIDGLEAGRVVIYTGHFSSSESPGANWHAEVYNLGDEEDKEDFLKECARLTGQPEDDPNVKWKRTSAHYPPADPDDDEDDEE